MMTLAVLLSLLNVLGGRGEDLNKKKHSRFFFRFMGMPLAISYTYANHPDWLYITICAFIGILIWAVPGHGKYFASWHGRYDPAEKEIGWIDRIGEKIYPYDDLITTNYRRGTLCMSLRGMFLYPMFIVLAPLNPLALVAGFSCLLQGPCYAAGRLFPEKYGALVGEALTGAVIGLSVGMVL